MDIRQLKKSDLDNKQLVALINAAKDKAHAALDEFEVEANASFHFTAYMQLMDMMMSVAEICSQLRTLCNFCEGQVYLDNAFSGCDRNGVLQIDSELLSDESQHAVYLHDKYSCINNELMFLVAFELALDILTEEEVMNAIF